MTLARCLVLSILVSVAASSPPLENVHLVSTEIDVDQGLYVHTFRHGLQAWRGQELVDETLLFNSPMPFEHEYLHKWPRNGKTLEQINGTEIIISTDSHKIAVSCTKAGDKSVKLVIRNSPTLSKTRVNFKHIAPFRTGPVLNIMKPH